MLPHKLACHLLLLILASSASAGELVVIVSVKNPLVALRSDQVEDIFLAETRRFPHGGVAVPIDQALGACARDAFYRRVAAKSPALLKAYWTKMVFTGRAVPPKEMAGDEAVRKLIAANADLIGYIDRDALNDSVKTVFVLR